MSEESLYDRIGGEDGVVKLVGAFYDRVLADPEIGPFFKHVPMEALRKMQKEFFSEALGGPLFYSGRPLREVHAGMQIKRYHLKRFTDCLLETLEAGQEDLKLERKDIDAIYSRIALEADEIAGVGKGEDG